MLWDIRLTEVERERVSRVAIAEPKRALQSGRTPPGWRSATSPRPFQRRLATIVDGITAP